MILGSEVTIRHVDHDDARGRRSTEQTRTLTMIDDEVQSKIARGRWGSLTLTSNTHTNLYLYSDLPVAKQYSGLSPYRSPPVDTPSSYILHTTDQRQHCRLRVV